MQETGRVHHIKTKRQNEKAFMQASKKTRNTRSYLPLFPTDFGVEAAEAITGISPAPGGVVAALVITETSGVPITVVVLEFGEQFDEDISVPVSGKVGVRAILTDLVDKVKNVLDGVALRSSVKTVLETSLPFKEVVE